MEGRFTEPSVLILASLASGPKHGYALIKDIETMLSTTLGPGRYWRRARKTGTRLTTTYIQDDAHS